jgi:hypothetical protein
MSRMVGRDVDDGRRLLSCKWWPRLLIVRGGKLHYTGEDRDLLRASGLAVKGIAFLKTSFQSYWLSPRHCRTCLSSKEKLCTTQLMSCLFQVSWIKRQPLESSRVRSCKTLSVENTTLITGRGENFVLFTIKMTSRVRRRCQVCTSVLPAMGAACSRTSTGAVRLLIPSRQPWRVYHPRY